MRLFKLLLLLSAVMVQTLSLAQRTHDTMHPKSFLDIGVGCGANYGIVGTKFVLGQKGSGVLLGVGGSNEGRALQLGIQGAYRSFFANVSIGAILTDEGVNGGTSYIIGMRTSLTKNKRLFTELGLGYSSTRIAGFANLQYAYPAGTVGIGYRIGGKSVLRQVESPD